MRVFWGCLRIISRWLVGLSVQGVLILLVLCAPLTLICSRILRVTFLLALFFSWRLSAHLLFLLLLLLLSLQGSARLLLGLPSPQLLRLLPLRSFFLLLLLQLCLSPLTCPLIRLLCGRLVWVLYLLSLFLVFPPWHRHLLLVCLFFLIHRLRPFLLRLLLLPGLPPLRCLLFLFSLPSSSFQGSAGVPGLGVGVPLFSGAPPFPSCPSAPSASGAPQLAAGWLPATAPAYDPHAFPSAPPPSDPLSDSNERYPDDDHPPFDPSSPLSLDSFRSKYRRMVEYISGLFPQAAGVPLVDPLPCVLFKSFFASSTLSQQSLSFNWFNRVRTVLMDADTRIAFWLAPGSSDRGFIPRYHISYAVRGPHASGKAVSVNESLLAHFDKTLRPSLLVGLSVRDAMALEASFRAQSEVLLLYVGIIWPAWVCLPARV